MEERYLKIEQVLSGVQSGRRRLRLALFGLLGLSVAIALLSLPGIVYPALSGWARLLFRAGFLAATLSSMGFLVYAFSRGRESIDSAALAVERHNPWLKNALINAVQLRRAARAGGPAAAFSPDFLARHIDDTAAGLGRIDLAPVLSRAPLKRPALVAGILALQFGLQLALLPSGRASGALLGMLADPWSVPAARQAGPALPLTTGDFSLSYFFPPYSGIEPLRVEHNNGDIAALRGASVTIETRVLEPLKDAAVVTSAGARYEMKVEGGTKLSAELVVSETGTWHIEGTDRDGKRRAEPGSHQIVADDDLPPKIDMLAPTADLEVAAEGNLDLSWAADDDFGLREVAFVFQRDGKEEKVLLEVWQDDGRTRLSGERSLPLSEIKARSGERIPFCLEATDNDEVSGGKTGRSQMLVLEVYSARKQHRELLARQDEFLNLLIDHLAGHIGGEVGSKSAGFNLATDEQKLLAEGLTVVSTLSQLLKDLQADEYADELLVVALTDMSSRYPGRLAERAAVIGKQTAIVAGPREKLLGLRLKYRESLENDVLYLDKLIKKQRVDDLLSEADDLYKARADLADLIEQYRRTGDPMLMEELQKKMAELQSAFQSLARRMAEMRKDLPEEFINADAMDKGSMMDLAEEMEKLRQMLVDGDMESAVEMADKFLAQMGQWMSQMEKNAGEMGDSMSAETMRKLSDIETRLQDMIKREQGVEDQLQELYQRGMEQSASDAEVQNMRGEIDQALRSYLQAVNEGQENFMGLQPMKDGKPAGFSLEQDRQRNEQARQYNQLRMVAEEMRRALNNNDLEGAARLGEQLKALQQGTKESLEARQKEMSLGSGQRMNQTRQSGGRADSALAEAMAKIKALQGATGNNLDPASRAELDELARLQEALRSDLEETQSDYEEIRAQTPSLPASVGQSMSRGMQQMHDASGEMQLGESGRALPQAAGARASMEQASEGLSQAKKKMGQGMGGGGMGFGMGGMGNQGRGQRGGRDGGSQGNMSQDRVEIPGKDAYKGPEQYREELLRAMREGSPEAYKNLNHDYYERLVR